MKRRRQNTKQIKHIVLIGRWAPPRSTLHLGGGCDAFPYTKINRIEQLLTPIFRKKHSVKFPFREMLTSNPCDGDASQFRVGEAQEKGATRTLLQHVLCLLPTDESHDGAETRSEFIIKLDAICLHSSPSQHPR